MGQSIFTCTFLGLKEGVYRVSWLRVVLEGFSEDTTFKKLAKLNSKFSIKIQQASITRKKKRFTSLTKPLLHLTRLNRWSSFYTGVRKPTSTTPWRLYLYDGDKLIAVGYFDVGKDSAAGISSFYDPDYKKYSLGIYLIYQKMLYCKNQQFKYFYPGYFAPGCRAFNYKLEIGKDSMEYYDLSSHQWQGMNTNSDQKPPKSNIPHIDNPFQSPFWN